MKKLFLISILFVFVSSIVAQEKFVIPEITDAKKHSGMLGQANAIILNTINYAKSMDQTVEELSTFTGNQFKKSWNKENGWEGFARGCLNNWTLMKANNQIEIIEQSETMLRFKSETPYISLKINGPRYNVSYDEYLTFLKINHQIIGEHLGATITFEEVEGGIKDGIILTITKK